MTSTPLPNPFESPQSPADPEGIAPPGPIDVPGLALTRRGLGLVYGAIIGIILTAFAIPLVTILFRLQSSDMALLFIGGLMVLLVLLYLVGVGLCVTVPQDSRARGLAQTALALHLLGAALTWGPALGSAYIGGAQALALLNAVGQLLGYAATFFFLLFLRKLARYLGSVRLVRSSTRVMAVGGSTLVLIMGAAAYMAFSGLLVPGPEDPPGANPPAGMVVVGLLGGIGGLMALVTFLLFANLVTYTRKAIPVVGEVPVGVGRDPRD